MVTNVSFKTSNLTYKRACSQAIYGAILMQFANLFNALIAHIHSTMSVRNLTWPFSVHMALDVDYNHNPLSTSERDGRQHHPGACLGQVPSPPAGHEQTAA